MKKRFYMMRRQWDVIPGTKKLSIKLCQLYLFEYDEVLPFISIFLFILNIMNYNCFNMIFIGVSIYIYIYIYIYI